ncbi:hypothetical protein NKH77_25640 [Streptomyces sp. M19]
MNLAVWRPTDTETRGYLVDGLLPGASLKPGLVGTVRRLLREADARMVIVLPDDPDIVRSLERDLHVTPSGAYPAAARRVRRPPAGRGDGPDGTRPAHRAVRPGAAGGTARPGAGPRAGGRAGGRGDRGR